MRFYIHLIGSILCASMVGCGAIPAGGPTSADISDARGAGSERSSIQVIELSPTVIQHLHMERSARTFADELGTTSRCADTLGVGDTLGISIWEAPPATLFGGGDTTLSDVPAGSRATTLPDQVIDAAGNVKVPFAGSIHAAGLTVTQLEAEIAQHLAGKAHEPQVLARLVRNAAADVTVVGDVSTSTRMPLTPKCERLLDAIAAAGGVRQPVDKITMQVTRGAGVYSMPLDSIIRDPRQNVPLRAGDVVTVLYQPSSFMAFGATGKNEEIPFEGKGISLAQALARAGGLLDSRANAKGVFVFRLEDNQVLAEGARPADPGNHDRKIPTVYRLDLGDPAGMFLAQQFEMNDKDALYVSNAPIADIQKLANLFYTIVFPAVSVGTQFR